MANIMRKNGKTVVGKLARRINETRLISEEYRLRTFQIWPPKSPLNPGELAKAGFFYFGYLDRVECFSCHGQIEEWEDGDEAMAVHKSFFPNCPFITGTDTRKIALGDATTDHDETDSYIPIGRSNVPSETGRLETFKEWPKVNPLQPDDLARAGFFYLGFQDRVQCFSCGGQIEDWERGDIAISEHERFFPHCAFVNGTDSHNIPLTRVNVVTESRQPAELWPGQSEEDVERRANEKEAALRLDFHVHSSTAEYANGLSSSHHSNKAEEHDVINRETVKSEAERLDTFKTWPKNNPLKPVELAKAGFVYSGCDDRVRCCSCGGQIKDWEIGDTAMGEHKKHFPKCNFLNQTDLCNTPPQNERNESVSGSKARSQINHSQIDTERQTPEKGTALRHDFSVNNSAAHPTQGHSKGLNSPGGGNNINTSAAPPSGCKHKRYADQAVRQGTFQDKNWLSLLGTYGPTSKLMATVGFFYTGTRDVCTCFHCDGTLSDWKSTSDPWSEHAMWFPTCPWVIQQKGGAFGDTVRIATTTPVDSLIGDLDQLSVNGPPDRENIGALRSTISPPSTKCLSDMENTAQQDDEDSTLCKICFEEKMNTLFMPCRHLATCEKCAAQVSECPMCRGPIQDSFPIYMSL